VAIVAAFLVEDGTGYDKSNAYDSLDNVGQYHADSGNDYWATLAVDAQQKGIVRATKYIDLRFAKSFRGTRRRRTQALAWPRLGAYDNDGFYIETVPVQVLRAVAEYALRAAWYQTLAPDVPRNVPGQDMSVSPEAEDDGVVQTGQVRSTTEKVGPIETVTSYITNAEIEARWKGDATTRAAQSSTVNDFYIPMYPEADLWIEQVLRNPFGAATITRGD
jgi:hypothetical protein